MLDAPDGNPQYIDPEEEKTLPSLTNPAYRNRLSIGQRVGGARQPMDSSTPVADGSKVRSPEVADVRQGAKVVPAPSFDTVFSGQPAPANRPSQLPAATGNILAPR